MASAAALGPADEVPANGVVRPATGRGGAAAALVERSSSPGGLALLSPYHTHRAGDPLDLVALAQQVQKAPDPLWCPAELELPTVRSRLELRSRIFDLIN